VSRAVRNVIERARREGTVDAAPVDWVSSVTAEVELLSAPSLRRVLNATGVVLHTNLGRAPLSPRMVADLAPLLGGYVNLEYDLATGRRGSRYNHCAEALRTASGAEDALVVNNNAAAVMLTLHALAKGKEVVISRGELVEIGGSFRIPEILEASGACLREVGTTNRTRLADYERAITPETALLLKVHPSNYRIEGFTEEARFEELVDLGRRRNLPVVIDLGSSTFDSVEILGKRGNTAREAVERGADVVTFSGDKLLGGPQAGIILGRTALLEKMRSDPWLRIVRVDKLTLALLERVVRSKEPSPVSRILDRSLGELKEQAERVISALRGRPDWSLRVVETEAQAGGGSLPEESIPSIGVSIEAPDENVSRLEQTLRGGDPPVVGRRREGALILDLRTILLEETGRLIDSCLHAMDQMRDK